MRYFCAEREKCQNLCTKQCSYKAEWGWERSWVNRRINLAERNRNLSHVKTCLFMNTIKAIILLSSLTVPKMAARGATWPRTSIRCEAVWCHRTILSLNANDFQGWLQAIINHFVLSNQLLHIWGKNKWHLFSQCSALSNFTRCLSK